MMANIGVDETSEAATGGDDPNRVRHCRVYVIRTICARVGGGVVSVFLGTSGSIKTNAARTPSSTRVPGIIPAYGTHTLNSSIRYLNV